ncbi:MAG: hypothetical protein BGO37_13120 [Cellulomonas sp. 73-92]|uniref:iron chaperone n=1 Tax=Cellulomonas sp. 73-92 TaxID=1895740 RepID=UPI000925F875|nr:DUF1801 domain-containing protein [Cellulomonas sp. 73-92]OJV82914.1 MAG: hypothetical protein BGO37_13120 [Cellulomonas sp. 73-92]
MGEVTDYVGSLDGAERAAVARVIERARRLVPDAQEGRSYGMPALRHRGRPLVAVVATRSHLALYPFSSAVIDALSGELAAFSPSKGTIRFQPTTPLPDDLVDRIVLARRDEIDVSLARR